MYRTLKELRSGFWENHPDYKEHYNKRQNEYNATIRSAWCEWIDHLQKGALITKKLATSATL